MGARIYASAFIGINRDIGLRRLAESVGYPTDGERSSNQRMRVDV
jgi:hypothetical protein